VDERATAEPRDDGDVTGASGPTVPPEPALGRIPALDGIRALAIVLVLVFHGGFSWAGGGFFGVDVFFVLSGFLITGLLVSEYRQNSGIGLKRFWGHRVRRLLPALLVMLAGVALYGLFLAPSDTLDELRSNAIATLAYVNNWHQISGGHGYFAALNTPQPLLHTWSLSIEEQFYVVWPLVVLGVLRWSRSLRSLLALTVLGSVASAIDMALVFGNGAGASRAYYGTDTRAQALLIGAALAVVLAHPLPRRRSGPVPTTSLVRSFALGRPARVALVALGGVGLAGVIWLSISVDATSTWIYRGGFTLVALATAGVIASVALLPRSPWGRVLSLRPVRYVGAISYGLYLYHWPIFVVLDHSRTGLSGWALFGLRVACSVAVAALSLHFLEMPVRRGLLRSWRGWVATPLALGATAALVVATTAGATVAVNQAPSTVATSLPIPKGNDLGTSPAVPVVPAGTGGPIRVMLVGDSEASFLGFGLGPESDNYNVLYAGDGVFGCGLHSNSTSFHGTVIKGVMGYRGGHDPVRCDTQLARWKADIATYHPDVVLMAEGEYEVRDQYVGRGTTNLFSPTFAAEEHRALTDAVAVLGSTGAPVVLLTAPFYRQQEQNNGNPWPEDDPARVRRYNAILRDVATASGGSAVVADMGAKLDPGGQFSQRVNGVNVRFADGIHVTQAGAELIAPWLLKTVAALGQASRSGADAAAGTTP
jgi:peptidoglycan/LPS O-acetylase OafA/YrhL/lysophospholipase L1-like esterase